MTKAYANLHKRSSRYLAISSVDALLSLALYEKAEYVLEKLKSYYNKVSGIDKIDQQRHLRTLVLYAQSLHRRSVEHSQWIETAKRWDAVIALCQKYAVIDNTGADVGIFYLSMSHVAQELDQREKSREQFHLAARQLPANSHFWIRGLGTYWFKFVSSKLPKLEAHLYRA